jgi:hypothetical protein
MATPPYVPVPRTLRIHRGDEFSVGPPRRLPPRPAEVTACSPHPPGFGLPCPDGGYALRLVEARQGLLALGPGERTADACAAIAAIGLRRAALLGRAPVLADTDIGRTVLGYDDAAPPLLRQWRRDHVEGAARSVEVCQQLADAAQLGLDLVAGPSREQTECWWRQLKAELDQERPS